LTLLEDGQCRGVDILGTFTRVPGYSLYVSSVKIRVLVVTSKYDEVVETVICVEISVPPPEFCCSDSMEENWFGKTQ
jgi:hypothetical protein